MYCKKVATKEAQTKQNIDSSIWKILYLREKMKNHKLANNGSKASDNVAKDSGYNLMLMALLLAANMFTNPIPVDEEKTNEPKRKGIEVNLSNAPNNSQTIPKESVSLKFSNGNYYYNDALILQGVNIQNSSEYSSAVKKLAEIIKEKELDENTKILIYRNRNAITANNDLMEDACTEAGIKQIIIVRQSPQK